MAEYPGREPGGDRVADLRDLVQILGGHGPDLDDDLAYDGRTARRGANSNGPSAAC